jgi:hypothetical protein
MVFGHDGILKISQLVLDDFDLINEPGGRSAGRPFRQFGGVARSLCPDTHMMPLGIGGGLVKFFDGLAQLSEGFPGKIWDRELVGWHHRRFPNCRDKLIDQRHITRAPKIAHELSLDLPPLLLQIFEEAPERGAVLRFHAFGLAFKVCDLYIEIARFAQLAA